MRRFIPRWLIGVTIANLIHFLAVNLLNNSRLTFFQVGLLGFLYIVDALIPIKTSISWPLILVAGLPYALFGGLLAAGRKKAATVVGVILAISIPITLFSFFSNLG